MRKGGGAFPLVGAIVSWSVYFSFRTVKGGEA